MEETETRVTAFNEAFTIAKHNFIKTMRSQANVILSRIKQKEMLFCNMIKEVVGGFL